MKLFKILGIMAIFLFPASAHAHTSVVSTVPTFESTIDAMPTVISIEFSDDLMLLGSKNVNELQINHPDGSQIKIFNILTKKNLLTAELPVANYVDGTYTVSYRVVSKDGHELSGSYEIYLNTPSEKVVSPVTVVEKKSFFQQYKAVLATAGTLPILYILWRGYRRFSAEQAK